MHWILHERDFIIHMAIAVAIGVFPIILGYYMTVSLWVLWPIEILAIVVIISAFFVKQIQKTYLTLRTDLRDFWSRTHILISQRKISHTAHSDVGTRFKLEVRTPDMVQKDMEAKVESLQNQIDKLKADKNENRKP